ncbi:MAG: sigma-70 family RNA polymerase sigma factor [Christensenellales bacterium]|jgi:RNA polymerase sigma-70 factor (ECF subfamily)
MKNINLRDVFPEYQLDCYIEVPDDQYEEVLASLTAEIAEVYVAFERAESTYQRRRFRYKAHCSLYLSDDIDADAVCPVLSAQEQYEIDENRRMLYDALSSMPKKQANRLYAHFFMGLSMM